LLLHADGVAVGVGYFSGLLEPWTVRQFSNSGLITVLPHLNRWQIAWLTAEQVASIPWHLISPRLRELTVSQCQALSPEQLRDFTEQQVDALYEAMRRQ